MLSGANQRKLKIVLPTLKTYLGLSCDFVNEGAMDVVGQHLVLRIREVLSSQRSPPCLRVAAVGFQITNGCQSGTFSQQPFLQQSLKICKAGLNRWTRADHPIDTTRVDLAGGICCIDVQSLGL